MSKCNRLLSVKLKNAVIGLIVMLLPVLYLSFQVPAVLAFPTSVPTFERTWGSAGTGQGQFTSPIGIVVSQDGRVYVSETANHRIQVFDADGNFLFQIGTGSAGSGNNEFTNPQGLAIDYVNNWLYVVDNGTGRIKKLTLDGTHIANFTEPPDADDDDGGADTWFNPNHIIVEQETGNVFLSIPGEGRVDALTSNGDFIWATAVGEANSARGIVIYGSDLFVVSQNLSIINVFDKDTGSLTRTIGSAGSGNGQFSNPRGLALDYEGYLYIADMGNARIQKLERSGNYLAQWGTSGSGNGQFNSVYALAFDPEGYKLYTTESAGNRVQKFTYIQLPFVNPPGYTEPVPQPETCSESLTQTPDFFEIKRDGSSATLYFTPIININNYVVNYGTGENTSEYGANFNIGWTDGVQSFTVEKLDPQTSYSFKIAGQRDCAIGPWSHTISTVPTKKLADTGAPVGLVTLVALSSATTALYLVRTKK